jgi:CRP/FNR family transcriptional regulator, anaerobic regulatory protein
MHNAPIIVSPPTPRHSCTHGRVDCDHCKIRLVSVCAAFKRDDLDALQNITQPVYFAAKESLFLENDDSDAAYTVTDGVIRLYRIFVDGRRQLLEFLLPGDFISIEASGHYGFSADAVTDVSLCRFPKAQFESVVDKRPHVLQKLYQTSAQELINSREHAMALGQRSASEKVAWFLIHLRNRWARTALPSNTIPVPMSRQDIADYLGLTIETVSRTLTSLENSAAIALPSSRRIVLRNRAALSRLNA